MADACARQRKLKRWSSRLEKSSGGGYSQKDSEQEMVPCFSAVCKVVGVLVVVWFVEAGPNHSRGPNFVGEVAPLPKLLPNGNSSTTRHYT